MSAGNVNWLSYEEKGYGGNRDLPVRTELSRGFLSLVVSICMTSVKVSSSRSLHNSFSSKSFFTTDFYKNTVNETTCIVNKITDGGVFNLFLLQ